MNLIRLCLISVVAISLAACAADQVELESRAISVDQQAEPAGAAGQQLRLPGFWRAQARPTLLSLYLKVTVLIPKPMAAPLLLAAAFW